MTTFATVLLEANTTKVFVQSADPVDLQNRLIAAFAALNADVSGLLVTTVNLAGAGDGHTFVVEIIASVPGNIASGTPFDPADVAPRCYMAANAFELAVQRARSLGGTNLPIADEQLAGAAQGTRFMGLILMVAGFGNQVEGVTQQIFSDTGTPGTASAGGAALVLISRPITIPAGVARGYLVDAELVAETSGTTGSGELLVEIVDSVAGVVASQSVTITEDGEGESFNLQAALDNVPAGARTLTLRVTATAALDDWDVTQSRMRTDIVLASALTVT